MDLSDDVKDDENVDWLFISQTETWLKHQPDPKSLADVRGSGNEDLANTKAK